MEKIQLHLSVVNRFGVLVRISELFARRGFNISSLYVHIHTIMKFYFY